MIDDVDNIISVNVPVKPHQIFVDDNIIDGGIKNVTIADAVIHFIPDILTSNEQYLKQTIGDGLTVQGLSTEVRYSTNLNGIINGNIYINEVGTSYGGTVIVKDCNTGTEVARSIIENGSFSINGLNPNLKYNLICIPKENNKYTNKFIEGFTPDIYQLDLKLEKYSEYKYRDESKYSAIFKVSNMYGDIAFNINAISGISELIVEKISDGLFKVTGNVTLNAISYSVIASETRGSTNISKSLTINSSLINRVLDIGFGTISEDKYNGADILITGNPLVSSYGNKDALITNSTNYISVATNNFLNVNYDEFELIYNFKILNKNNNGSVCLLSTESSSANTSGNITIEIMNYGLKVKYFDGTPDHISNTIMADYIFDTDIEYALKISKYDGIINIYINEIMIYSGYNVYNKPINFASGGKLHFGYAKWYATSESNLVISRFKIIKNNRFDKEKYKKNSIDNILYAINFTNKILDINNNEYGNDGYILVNNKLIKDKNSISNVATGIKYFDGLVNIFTIEFNCKFEYAAEIQYILYNDKISIYYNNNRLYLKIIDEIFSINILDTSINYTITISKFYNDIEIIVNDKLYTFTSLNKYLSTLFLGNASILSDLYNKNIFIGKFYYILFDSNLYKANHINVPLIMQYENLDMASNETFYKELASPKNSVGTVTWSVADGTLPSGISLTNNVLSGIPLDTGRFIFKLKCIDSINNVGYIRYNIQVGTIVSYCQFEGDNNASSMTDMVSGRIWTSNSSAVLSQTTKVFGNASTYLNGGAADWTTPSSSDFYVGQDDFTISMWVYNTQGETGTHRSIISQRNNWSAYNLSFCLMRYANSNKYMFEGWTGPASFGFQFGDAKVFEWEFITISRKGGMLYCSQNGVVYSTQFPYNIYAYNYPLAIGQGDVSNSSNFLGYIDDLKFVKGSGLYTTDFMPPKKPSDYPANILKTAPYNLYTQYKNDIFNIRWTSDEYNCTYNVYISETPMLTNNMPSPYMSNITNNYININNIALKKYYIRVASVRNTSIVISDEILVDLYLNATLWSPVELDNEVWLDFADVDTITYDFADRISEVVNKSGKGNNCKAPSRSRMPIYNINKKCITALNETNTTLSGKISVTGEGTNNSYSVFFVTRPKKSTATQYAQANSGTNYWSYDTNNSPLMNISHYNSGDGGCVVPYWSTTTNAISMTEQRTNLAPFNVRQQHAIGSNIMISSFIRDINARILKGGINGTYANGIFSSVNNIGWELYHIFGRYYNSNPYSDIHEIILIREALSDNLIQKIEGYLAHKWKITASLPVNHIYKNDYPQNINITEAEFFEHTEPTNITAEFFNE